MDTNSKQEIRFSPPDMIVKALTVLLVVFSLLGIVQVFTALKEYRFVGSGTTATNTITVSGEGEVFAVPDIAMFSVTIEEEALEVKDAQEEATKKTNDIVAYFKESGILDKDIKTLNYNVYPQYDWVQKSCDRNGYCPGGEQVLRGYSVSQTIEVKVRDTDTAGDLLAGVGSRGATTVSGLSFTIDDEDELHAEARADAIEDAEEKAEELAGQLGVTLVRIVGFSEDGNGYYPTPYLKREVMTMAADSAMGGAVAPELPMGENKIQSNVTITYEIR